MKTTMLCLCAGALLLGACKSTTTTTVNTPGATQTTVTAPKDANQLVNALTGDWAVIDINGNAVSTTNADVPYMGFSPNEETPGVVDFYAFNGCNFINGVLAFNGAKIKPQGEFASTMRMCADAPYEMAMTTALQKMDKLNIERINNESFLYLRDSHGQTVMTLRKHNLNFLNGAWRVTKINGNAVPKKVVIEAVIDLQNNTIHGNAGCNTLNGNLKVNMNVENGLTFTDLRTTRMTCPDIAYETAFLEALGSTTTVVPGTNNDVARFNNASHQTVIEMRRLTKEELAQSR